MTTLRRSSAACGFVTGSVAAMLRTMPANNAAWATVSLSGVVLKYVRAAAATPAAPLPNETMFRYRVRISSFDSARSICSAICASLSLRAEVCSVALSRSVSVFAAT